jgi:hypothetical protein
MYIKFKTKFTKSDIRALHRPSIQFPLEQEIHFSRMKKIKKKKIKSREAMKKSKDLTLKDKSDFVLFEYSVFTQLFLIILFFIYSIQ